MSTYNVKSRLHTHAIYLIVSFLGGLLISLQLVLPSTTFAASPRASSAGYTFGSSQPMDLASVAVVRLVIATNPTSPARPVQCNTGLGVIVNSNRNTGTGQQQQGSFLNTVLTDGSLLTCSENVPSISIVIYPNAAYTSNDTSITPLATLTCNNPVSSCGSNAIQFSGKLSTCENAACSKGAALLSFTKSVPQPYIAIDSSATSTTSTAFPIELVSPSQGTPGATPGTTSVPQNLVPFNPDQQTNGVSATPTANTNEQLYEFGTPFVDNNGLVVGMHTSTDTPTGATGIKSFPTLFLDLLTPFQVQPSLNNPLQAHWKAGIQYFYNSKPDYVAAVNEFHAAAAQNSNFRAATNFQNLASTRMRAALVPSSTPNASGNSHNTPVPAGQNAILDIPFWLLAIIGLIVVVLLLLLISFLVARRRRGLAQFEKEQEAASRTAELEAQRIRMEEASRRVAEPVPGQQGHAEYPATSPFALPVPAQGLPADSQQGQVDLRCPNCGYPFIRGDAFCSNCRAVLAPSESGYHVRMVQPPPQSPPVQQSPVLMPPSINEMPTLEMSPSQQSLAEETTAPGPGRMSYFNGHNISIAAGSRSDPGIKRKQKPNEDSLLAVMGERTHNSLPQQFGLFVVADGMGGHANGQDASRLAIQTMVDRILPRLSSSEDLDDQALVQLLVQGVQQANMAVYERNLEHHADMGTTMTSAIVVGGMAFVANVGDSRTYMYREPEGLHKITHDHSVVASLVEAGIIRNEDIYTHPKRNQIYRSLGEKSDLEVDSFVEHLQPGDKLLLCSDGLWEMVHDRDLQRDKDIQRIMSISNADPKQTVNALINAANEGGGEDNISVIVVSVTEATARTGMTGFHLLEKPETVQMPRI